MKALCGGSTGMVRGHPTPARLAAGGCPCEQHRGAQSCASRYLHHACPVPLSCQALFSWQFLCSFLSVLSDSRCPNGLLCPATFWFDLLQLLPLLNSVRLAPPPVIKRRTFQVDISSLLPVSKLIPIFAVNQLATCLSSPTEGFPRVSGRAEGLSLKQRKSLM